MLTDGQQRVTTTMLFLMALRDGIDDEAYRSTIQRGYIQNDQASEDTKAIDTSLTHGKSLTN